ncbi:MAG: transporter [Candidatus Nealsonbacteria bacterium]|nr:transporter [Candidatus Nealsonbacteria bacterium]
MPLRFLLIFLSVLVTVTAQLFIKMGVVSLGKFSISFGSLPDLILRVLQNIWIMGGLILFGLSFALWILILSRLQLNVIYPVIVSLNFSLIAIVSWFLFKEYLSLVQVLGIIIIIFGVFLVLPKGV